MIIRGNIKIFKSLINNIARHNMATPKVKLEEFLKEKIKKSRELYENQLESSDLGKLEAFKEILNKLPEIFDKEIK